jgi:hypothetical protein
MLTMLGEVELTEFEALGKYCGYIGAAFKVYGAYQELFGPAK